MDAIDASLTDRLVGAVARVVDGVSGAVAEIGDERVLELLRDASQARHALDVVIARLSTEVERRSPRESGRAGLAQRKGHRTVTSLVQNITGQSRGDVGRALRTGHELDAAVRPEGWDAGLREALTSGRVGPEQYRAIRSGLGEPPVERYPDLDPSFLPDAWSTAVAALLEEVGDLAVEDLRAAARTARDRLDPIGVTLRFEERFAARSFRAWIDESGQHHARLVFDDEAAAWVHGILNAALRPRRGPRFVGADAAEKTAVEAADERSNEQLQYDTLIAVLRAGAAADPTTAFGDRQPGVRIVVEQSAIVGNRVEGVGHVEDGGAALPGGVVEKYLCDAGSVALTVDPRGRPLDLGREHRLFTRAQRIAIAVRDGGCIAPHCSAPISWSEFHHIDHWSEDNGRTDVDDGVPLCRNCHLRAHNQGVRIRRVRDPQSGEDAYWWHAPPDPVTSIAVAPVRLRSRSPRRFAVA